MGTSYIEYKGFGFWSRDSFIESWLTTLMAEIRKSGTLETWQESMLEHWRIQTIVQAGVMSLKLDEFLNNGSKHEFVLAAARRAVAAAETLGRETGVLFINLLEGRLRTNVASPVDYLHWPEDLQKT